MKSKILNIGIDVGSTTVKMVVMNNKNEILYSEYRRHFSDTKKTIKDLFNEVKVI
jgi:activator of 2-hydroxyglutaryl-CoA dehydratase